MEKENALVLWFDQLSIGDVPLVGGKNASLGEMYQNLAHQGVSVPNGFAVTAHAYHYLLEQNNAKDQIRHILSDLNTDDIANLQERGRRVRDHILHLDFPADLRQAILDAYYNLCKEYGANADVAVRSSATAEDLPDASFAGQQETYLNIRGEQQLLEACKKCFASLFTDRAISYRENRGFDHFTIGLSIGVQKMVRSDKACSGVMFSIDTETGFRDAVLLTGSWGLGENIVQGSVNPDEWYIFKPTLAQGKRPIISRKLGAKQMKLIYDTSGNKQTKNVQVDSGDTKRFCLNDDEVVQLARWAVIIEKHYTASRGKFTPMDMEWAKDGDSGQLFIVQARPETVHANKDATKYQKYVLKGEGSVLVQGTSVGERIGAGEANVIKDVHNIAQFRKGQVLVTEMTDPDWEPIMKIASAIVTNRGGRTCHAAIISRELGIPCVVGAEGATERIASGQEVTVSCAEGEVGKVYSGRIEFEIEEHDLKQVPSTRTHIMMNVGNPSLAFELSKLPNEGVGLAREEFIINSYIKIHPLALLHYDQVKDDEARRLIAEHTAAYTDKAQFFVDKLAEGVAMIGAAFYPKPVIVRLSDFKTNEYANLIGGKGFEPHEDNPMIGWRGASRYYDPKYREGFSLECRALKKVRDEMGLTNVTIMIPFCRTLKEGRAVLTEMEQHGLRRGVNDLKVYVMCEIPSNVILADQFLEEFDGMSIGSNDLTQLTLGLDRDSEIVAHIYDERNEAVKRLVSQVIKTANAKGKYIGICGQAPSDYIDFAEFLVREGIQSISLNPDTVLKTRVKIAEVEAQIANQQ